MLAIRSSDRTSGTPSDYRIRLQQPISGTWECVHCLIPNTIYSVRDDCNKVRFALGGATHELALTPGFYGVDTLVAGLQTLLRTVDGGFTVTYDALTARVAISHTSMFELLWASLAHSLAPVLGYAEVDTGTGTAHVAGGTVELTRDHLSFNVVVGPNTSYGITDTAGRHSTFLVSNTENTLDYISWNASQSYRQRVLFRTPTRELTVKLQSASYRDVDLNDGEWLMLWSRIS